MWPRARIVMGLALLGVTCASCTAGDPPAGGGASTSIAAPADDSTGGDATTIAEEPADLPTKAEAVAQIEELCRRFLVDVAASPDPDVRTREAQRAYVTFRTAVIDRTLPNIESARLPAGDDALVATGIAAFTAARALYQAALAPDADVAAASTLIFDGDGRITSFAVQLVEYGATACLPGQRPTPPPSPPADAGRLVAVAPSQRVEVAAPGAAPNRLVADLASVWIALRYEPVLVQLDATTGAVLRRVGLSSLSRPQVAKLHLEDGTLWGTTPGEVFRIDGRTGDLVSRSLASLSASSGAAVAIVAGTGYLCGSGRRLVQFDVRTVTTTKVLTLPDTCDGMAVRDGRLLVESPREWFEVDEQGRVQRLPNHREGSPSSAPSLDGATLWHAARDGSGLVRAYDLRSGAEQHRVVRSGRNGQTDVAVDGVLFCTRPLENRVLRIDTRGGIVEFLAGAGPSVLAASGRSLWVANEYDGTVMRFDLDQLAAG